MNKNDEKYQGEAAILERAASEYAQSNPDFPITPAKTALLVIDLQDGEFVSLGTETEVKKKQSTESILDALPAIEDEAISRQEVLSLAEVKATLGKEILNQLLDTKVISKKGRGVTNNPFLYWKQGLSQSEGDVVPTNQVTEDKHVSQSVLISEVPTNLLQPQTQAFVGLDMTTVFEELKNMDSVRTSITNSDQLNNPEESDFTKQDAKHHPDGPLV